MPPRAKGALLIKITANASIVSRPRWDCTLAPTNDRKPNLFVSGFFFPDYFISPTTTLKKAAVWLTTWKYLAWVAKTKEYCKSTLCSFWQIFHLLLQKKMKKEGVAEWVEEFSPWKINSRATYELVVVNLPIHVQNMIFDFCRFGAPRLLKTGPDPSIPTALSHS